MLAEITQENAQPVTQEEGVKMAESINAVKYLECSVVTQVGLDNIFDEAVRFVIATLHQ